MTKPSTVPRADSGEAAQPAAKKVMDDALRRALSTPPTPHDPTKKRGASKAAAKPRRKAERGS